MHLQPLTARQVPFILLCVLVTDCSVRVPVRREGTMGVCSRILEQLLKQAQDLSLHVSHTAGACSGVSLQQLIKLLCDAHTRLSLTQGHMLQPGHHQHLADCCMHNLRLPA